MIKKKIVSLQFVYWWSTLSLISTNRLFKKFMSKAMKVPLCSLLFNINLTTLTPAIQRFIIGCYCERQARDLTLLQTSFSCLHASGDKSLFSDAHRALNTAKSRRSIMLSLVHPQHVDVSVLVTLQTSWQASGDWEHSSISCQDAAGPKNESFLTAWCCHSRVRLQQFGSFMHE